jgi:hypothetical protein
MAPIFWHLLTHIYLKSMWPWPLSETMAQFFVPFLALTSAARIAQLIQWLVYCLENWETRIQIPVGARGIFCPPETPRLPLSPTPTPIHWVLMEHGVAGTWSWPPTPSVGKVKDEWNYTSASHYALMDCTGATLVSTVTKDLAVTYNFCFSNCCN